MFLFRNEVWLFLIDFAACCDSVSHAEVHDTHCEHNEEREAFCISRRSYKLGADKYNS